MLACGLNIGGLDPTGGAGILADIKAMESFGVFGCGVATAITIQRPDQVLNVWLEPPERIVKSTLEVCNSLPIRAIKLGMIGSGRTIEKLASVLRGLNGIKIVTDPVLKASDGTLLLDKKGLKILLPELCSLSEIVTPNINELSAITGKKIRDHEDAAEAAQMLLSIGAGWVYVKGGHLNPASREVIDLLVGNGVIKKFTKHRLPIQSAHGTGCAFAASLAAALALGQPVRQAAASANRYIQQTLRRSWKPRNSKAHLLGFSRYRSPEASKN